MPVIHIEMKMRLESIGVETRNVFYMSAADAGEEQIGGTIDAIRTAYATHIAPQLSTTWKLYGATWRNISVVGMGGVDVTISPVTGTATIADLLPPQVAGLVSFKTGTVKPNQGRKYLSGFTENAQANGRWTPTVLSAMQAWGNAIAAIGGGAGSDRPLGVARIDPNTGQALAWNPYSVAVAREVTATMRSRRIGQGI